MASQSSRPKIALSDRRDEVARLLREGAIIPRPSQAMLDAARALEQIGLLVAATRQYVRCADPQDTDFPPKNRNCTGHIYLQDGLDEAGHDFRCPECERPVFPFRGTKRRHPELHVTLRPDGVIRYIAEEAARLGTAKELCRGMVRVEFGSLTAHLCVVEICTDPKYLASDWARNQPTLYVAIDKSAIDQRFLSEDWLARTSLADILCSVADLHVRMDGVARQGTPGAVRNVSVPVYRTGPPPITVEPVEPVHHDRVFVVQVSANMVMLQGEQIVAPQARIRFDIFMMLWARFLEDLAAGTSPRDFRVLDIDGMLKAMERKAGKRVSDEMTVRRAVNRLQADIETTVKKKLGLPISGDDVVQTVRWKGQGTGDHGYRINPYTVAARPRPE